MLSKFETNSWICFFPTCQVRAVRFYVSASPPPPPPPPSPRPPPRLVVATAIICSQCSATTGHQSRSSDRSRSSAPSVRYRTPTAITHSQPRSSATECQERYQKDCQKDCQKECQTECQEICQKECQKICQKIC